MPRKFLKAPPRAPERTDLGVGMPVCASALQKSPSKRRTRAKREQDGLHTRTCCEPPGHAASVLKRPQAALAKSKRSAQASGIDSPKGRDGTDEAGPARCAAPEPDPLQGGDARWTTGVKEGKRRKEDTLPRTGLDSGTLMQQQLPAIKEPAHRRYATKLEKVPNTMALKLTTFVTPDGVRITPNPLQVQYVKSVPLDEDQSGTHIHFSNADVVYVTAEHDNVVEY